VFKRKFDVPGPDQLNRCEVAAESSLLTCSHLYKSRFAFQWPFRVSCSQERAVISVIIYSLNCRESTPSTFAVCPFLDVVAVVVSLSWSAYFPLSSSFCLTRQDKVLEAVIQVQVASDQSWLVMLSRPGRSGGDEPGFIVIEVGNHELRTLNILLSSGTSAGSFAVFAGPLINYRTQAGTKKEQIQKKGWKMGFHVSVLRSCEFPFQGVQGPQLSIVKVYLLVPELTLVTTKNQKQNRSTLFIEALEQFDLHHVISFISRVLIFPLSDSFFCCENCDLPVRTVWLKCMFWLDSHAHTTGQRNSHGQTDNYFVSWWVGVAQSIPFEVACSTGLVKARSKTRTSSLL